MPAQGLYVATGTTVSFQAIPTPADASWPSGQPVWGGSCGATGTGPTTSVTLSVPSQSMTDYQTITATCGNTVSGNIIRYGPDQGTLTVDFDPNDSSRYIATATYTLWQPDINGVPAASGGNVILSTIDFNHQTDFTESQVQTWTFSNGVSATQTYVIASGIVQSQSGSAESDEGTSPTSGFSKLERTPTKEQSHLAQLTNSHRPVRRLYQINVSPEVAKLEKQLFDQTLKIIAAVRKSFQQKSVMVTPGPSGQAQVANTTDTPTNTAVQLSMTTTAKAQIGPLWFSQPNITIQETATPATVTDKNMNIVAVQITAKALNSPVIGMMNISAGWLKQNTQTVGSVAPWNLLTGPYYWKFGAAPSFTYAAAFWYDPQLNIYRDTRYIGATYPNPVLQFIAPPPPPGQPPISPWWFPNNNANNELDMFATISWPR